MATAPVADATQATSIWTTLGLILGGVALVCFGALGLKRWKRKPPAQ